MEYVRDIKANNGGITRVMYYKPYNRKNYTSMDIIKDPMNNTDYMINEIEHNVKLPDDVRPMQKCEYNKSILKMLDFVDEIA